MLTARSPDPGRRRLTLLLGLLLVVACAGLWVWFQGPGSQPIVAAVVRGGAKTYHPPAGASLASPQYTGADAARPHLEVALEEVATGFTAITDLQFPPGTSSTLVVAEKGGRLLAVDLITRRQHVLAQFSVATASEEGLLGVAFHPHFVDNGKMYTNMVVKTLTGEETHIIELVVGGARDLMQDLPVDGRTVLSQRQPYANHNGGQLQFGPDGYLYVGLGDGGSGGDPHGNGQKTDTWLGKILRLDVDHPSTMTAYTIPADNPFRDKAGYRPEIFALGLRNPWRFSFAPDGRLVVADVGQNQWEELDIVVSGANLGWNTREGRRCFGGGTCDTSGLVDPFYEYPHGEGTSITGGYVYTGSRMPQLQGRYVFGDFTAGRLWAIDLPRGDGGTDPLPVPTSLGKRGILISTFGRDNSGEIYVGDFGGGRVFRLAPASTPATPAAPPPL